MQTKLGLPVKYLNGVKVQIQVEYQSLVRACMEADIDASCRA